jgi:hypothetical protein
VTTIGRLGASPSIGTTKDGGCRNEAASTADDPHGKPLTERASSSVVDGSRWRDSFENEAFALSSVCRPSGSHDVVPHRFFEATPSTLPTLSDEHRETSTGLSCCGVWLPGVA